LIRSAKQAFPGCPGFFESLKSVFGESTGGYIRQHHRSSKKCSHPAALSQLFNLQRFGKR